MQSEAYSYFIWDGASYQRNYSSWSWHNTTIAADPDTAQLQQLILTQHNYSNWYWHITTIAADPDTAQL